MKIVLTPREDKDGSYTRVGADGGYIGFVTPRHDGICRWHSGISDDSGLARSAAEGVLVLLVEAGMLEVEQPEDADLLELKGSLLG